MKTSEEGIALIKSFEQCRLTAYQDSVGVWTIGWGHTGKEVTGGLEWSQDLADGTLEADLVKAERCVSENVTVPLMQNEFDALVSWVFNLGCGNFKGSTLLKRLNESDFNAVGIEILRWDHAGKQQLAGLTRRRAAEQELFLREPA